MNYSHNLGFEFVNYIN